MFYYYISKFMKKAFHSLKDFVHKKIADTNNVIFKFKTF